MPDKRLTIRLPEALWDSLHEEYAQTYPTHRLSMNAWLVKRLEESK